MMVVASVNSCGTPDAEFEARTIITILRHSALFGVNRDEKTKRQSVLIDSAICCFTDAVLVILSIGPSPSPENCCD